MKYTVTHKFNYSLFDLLRAREDRYKYLDKFPDLKNVTLLEEKKEGNLIFQKRKVSLASSLPPVLVPLLDDAALLEESTFNTDTNTHDFKLFPPKNEKTITITGHSVYHTTSDGFSERVYNVEVKSGVLFIGGLVEAAIEGIHKHSLEKDRISIQKFLDDKMEK
jgi:hypothetical protein